MNKKKWTQEELDDAKIKAEKIAQKLNWGNDKDKYIEGIRKDSLSLQLRVPRTSVLCDHHLSDYEQTLEEKLYTQHKELETKRAGHQIDFDQASVKNKNKTIDKLKNELDELKAFIKQQKWTKQLKAFKKSSNIKYK